MNIENEDDKWIDETLKRAVGTGNGRFDAAAWMDSHREEVELLKSRIRKPAGAENGAARLWRTIMNSRKFKILAPATVAAAIIVMVMIFTIGGNPKIALANVLTQLQGKSYEFAMDVQVAKETLTYQCMVMEPGKMRASGGAPDFGSASMIMDEGRILLLLDKMKLAMYIDKNKAMYLDKNAHTDPGASGEAFTIYTLLERSITNLWNLQGESGKKLERKKIDGVESEGFLITQKIGEGITQEITLWADAKTAFPTRIEIVMKLEREKDTPMTLVLKGFKIIEKPDASLFALTAPQGYRMLGNQTLKELAESRKEVKTTPEAEKILKAIQLDGEDKTDQAIETLLSVDWKEEIRFSFDNYLFTISQEDYMSLVDEDKPKVNIVKQLDQLQTLAREARSRSLQVDFARAEKLLNANDHLADLCKGNKLRTVETVGITLRTLGAQEKVTLYQAQGDAAKVEEAKKQIKQAKEEIEAMNKREKEMREKELPAGKQN